MVSFSNGMSMSIRTNQLDYYLFSTKEIKFGRYDRIAKWTWTVASNEMVCCAAVITQPIYFRWEKSLAADGAVLSEKLTLHRSIGYIGGCLRVTAHEIIGRKIEIMVFNLPVHLLAHPIQLVPAHEQKEMEKKHVKCIKNCFQVNNHNETKGRKCEYDNSCYKSSTKMILLIKCNEEMLSRRGIFIKLAAPSFSFVCWSGCFYLRFCVASLFTLGFYCGTSSVRAHADFMGIYRNLWRSN